MVAPARCTGHLLRVLGPSPGAPPYCARRAAPSTALRQNPFRLYRHYQFQVILSRRRPDVQEVYLSSLGALRPSSREHDIRFEEENWSHRRSGPAGVGWQ